MPKLVCAVLDDYQGVAAGYADWSRLGDAVDIDFRREPIAVDRLATELAGYEIIVAMRERTPFDAALLAKLPRLKLLVTTGMANASIDLDAARGAGIVVCGTRGVVGPAAELAWTLLLALTRRIPEEVANFRAGGRQWQLGVGAGLQGKTLGVVGLGKLGERMVRYGTAFGMDVLGWTRTDTAGCCAKLGIAPAASLDDLLSRADVLALQVTLNAGTHGMIGARELGLMKPGAILVNTSRGPIVDEAALIAALESGRLGGAALDVYDQEPLSGDHPFRRLPNVVATPHLGYVTDETYRIFFADAVDDIASWLAGSPLRVLNAAP